ncbi:MAG: glycosyltransferase family 4 protein [Chloroflexota bacterium]
MSESEHRFGFVMEQTLGHVTHYRNLRATVDSDPSIRATWFPVPFEPASRIEALPPLVGNWSARASWHAARALREDNASRHFDALFFHTQVSTLLSAGLMRRVPSVISLDATPMNYDAVGQAYGHQRGGRRAEAAKRWMNVRPLRAAAAIITWCDWARQSLVSDYGVEDARVHVIAPGVNLSLWPHSSPSSDGGPMRILFVGGDFERKGGETLLQAFAALNTPCELHLVTKAAIEPRQNVFVYHDVAPNSDLLKQLFATADVFALPTLADCFPVAIQEAMAAGLPVVSTDVGAVGEAVREGMTGLLAPPGDVTQLRLALESLAGDPRLRRAMGARGREVAEREYDSAVNARRILSLMTGLAARAAA